MSISSQLQSRNISQAEQLVIFPACAQVFCSAFQALLYALCYHLEGLLGRVPKVGHDLPPGQKQQARSPCLWSCSWFRVSPCMLTDHE